MMKNHDKFNEVDMVSSLIYYGCVAPSARHKGKKMGIDRGAKTESLCLIFQWPIPNLCEKACNDEPNCKAYPYVKPNTTQGPNPRCWLKYKVAGLTIDI